MEMTWEYSSSRQQQQHHRNPSFSSSLLDQIYRSIDDSPPKMNNEDYNNKLVFHRSTRTTTSGYSNSTSSDSSGSLYGTRSKSPRQPKPIRTSVDSNVEKPNSKQDLGGFLRTKTKALKIYTDLKKVKQPISPGGKLATFLNSLFTNNTSHTNTKKSKKTTEPPSPAMSASTTTCSSASSFSKSCLSKTPTSSSGKSKRSVRFCPVLDEEYSSSLHMPPRHVMEEENRRVIEAAKDLLRTYRKNKDHLAVTTKCENVQEEEDYDDAASCASSDLFELENLSAIGIDRYREELPVYETTRFGNKNRAIATCLLV